MLSDNAIQSLGFKTCDPTHSGHQAWVFAFDDTRLMLQNELGTALYQLFDCAENKRPNEVWRGALHTPSTLVRKLIKHGGNYTLSGAPDMDTQSQRYRDLLTEAWQGARTPIDPELPPVKFSVGFYAGLIRKI